MIDHKSKDSAPESINAQERIYMQEAAESTAQKSASASNTSSAEEPARKQPSGVEADVEKTMQLGAHIVGVLGGVIDLARMEALLAMRTLPKLIMLCLLIMPVMLLAWCAFSVFLSWMVFSASSQAGLGFLTFLLLQILLLLICIWGFYRFKARMNFPYTRAQVEQFTRSIKDEFNAVDKTKK
ncbi:hypothetical protein [Cellvibrio sp. NN19]|uniref:hypothetical protein n=1 Tax=Cellvibrio chitinivorans TaxID=3102792 RepID=UPI002B411E9E|nr:hypothetical protein [Cellvibrio sp. NN19]